ncbi:MAG: hypothetical protein V3T72_07245, partial [Thermoanaerobaculia bacterium]
MDILKLRCFPVTIAVWVLGLPLALLSPVAAQDAELGSPAVTLCATDVPLGVADGLLPPAPIEQQVCGPCILDTCAAEKVRCTFTGCGLNDCCEYSCVCDESCASGNIPGGACLLRLPICDRCGNGNIDFGEDCDGTNLGGATCESLGFHAGTLSCDLTCMFDTSQCIDQPVCGNDVCEWGEDCE